MKRIIILIALACAPFIGDIKANPATIKEFTNGNKIRFSTEGHAKAKGLNMTIAYPSSWKAKEGDRPNILQKFVGNDDKGPAIVMIVTKSLPNGTSINTKEAQEFFTEESMKELVPEGGTFIRSMPTKIEGIPAGILEFSQRGERAGMVIEMQTMTYIFFSGSTMVQIQCQVGSLPGSHITVKDRMNEMKPLFTLIASSIVLPDKWK